jgi:TM2 domain-containing membrane protein YozV
MESPTSEKSRVVAGVLGLYLGWLGIHKFYLGIPTARYHLIVGGAGLALLLLALVISAVATAAYSSGMFAGVLLGFGALFSVVGYLALLVSGIAGHVEGVMYLAKSDEQFSEIYAQGKKAWF